MNAANEHYPAREIPQPATVHKVEICARSGLLATDKCYDVVKSAEGEGVRRRTTYLELATDKQMPTEPCNVHGEARARLVRDLPASGFPRAALAVDPTQVSPIAVQGPVLLAENDPYSAIKSTVKPKPPQKEKVQDETAETSHEENAPLDPTKPIMKAEAVEPESKPILKALPVEPGEETPVPVRRAQPVHPSDEVSGEEMLRATPPPPADLGD